MLRSAMFVMATFYLSAAAAQYPSLSAVEDHIIAADTPKIVLSLAAEDSDGPDSDDGGVDPAESPPDDDVNVNDDSIQQRVQRTKNFLRFGRSHNGAAVKTTGANDGSNSARFSRADVDDNFIRLGRANFMRLGRADTESAAGVKNMVTRGANSNFIRLGRSRTVEPSNFIRFGRGNSGFIRFGRSGDNEEYDNEERNVSNESLARQTRSSTADSNFIRFGRQGLSDRNFMRLGRSDNFLRFGKGENYLRFGRGSAGNFIRFGRAKNTDTLFGRGKLTDRNFIRLGRSGAQHPDENNEIAMRQIRDADNVKPSVKSSTQYIRFGKRVPEMRELSSNFMRFGRDLEHINPQERQPSNNRSKRSIVPDDEIIRSELYEDYPEQAENLELPFRYYSPITGVPFAPELTVLPSFHPKRALGGGNDNFIRFG